MKVEDRLHGIAELVERAGHISKPYERLNLLRRARSELALAKSGVDLAIDLAVVAIPLIERTGRVSYHGFREDLEIRAYWETAGLEKKYARLMSQLRVRSIAELAEYSEAAVLNTPFVGHRILNAVRRVLQSHGTELLGTNDQRYINPTRGQPPWSTNEPTDQNATPAESPTT